MVENYGLAKANEELEKRERTAGQSRREWGWCSWATYQQEEIISRQATPRMRCTFLIWDPVTWSCSLPIGTLVRLRICSVWFSLSCLMIVLLDLDYSVSRCTSLISCALVPWFLLFASKISRSLTARWLSWGHKGKFSMDLNGVWQGGCRFLSMCQLTCWGGGW